MVDPDVLYIDDGDVLTSAGKAAGMDLCLHLVRTDHGRQWPTRWRAALVVPRTAWVAGPRSSRPRSRTARTTVLADLLPWAEERIEHR